MTHLIKLATGKLNDPILMDWALDRYRQAREGHSPRQQAMEQTWFDELTLRRWLNSDDHETLNRLFVHLPEEQFSNLGQAIAERWNDWGGNLAYHSAPVLARYQPELAWRCFAEPPGGRHRDVESILGVIRSLPVLPPEDGLVLLKAIATQVIASTEGSFSRELKLSELLSASLAFDRVVALEVIKAQLKAITSIREWDRLLDQVARGLFGHSVYGQLASDIRKGHSNQSFQQLAPFFREDAPLERLDDLSRKDSGVDDLTVLVDRLLDEQDHIIVQLISEATQSERLAEHRERLEAFLIGIVASACEHKVLDATHMPLQETATLLAADLVEPRHFEALLARLRMFDQGEVMPALVESLERERTAYGSLGIATAMGELGWEGFTTPLTVSMGEECGDFLHEAANKALIRIGKPARDH